VQALTSHKATCLPAAVASSPLLKKVIAFTCERSTRVAGESRQLPIARPRCPERDGCSIAASGPQAGANARCQYRRATEVSKAYHVLMQQQGGGAGLFCIVLAEAKPREHQVVARAGRHAGCLPLQTPLQVLFERVVLGRIACHIVRGNYTSPSMEEADVPWA